MEKWERVKQGDRDRERVKDRDKDRERVKDRDNEIVKDRDRERVKDRDRMEKERRRDNFLEVHLLFNFSQPFTRR